MNPVSRDRTCAALLACMAIAVVAGSVARAAGPPPPPGFVAAPLAIAAGGQGDLKVTVTPIAGYTLVAAPVPPVPNGNFTPLTLILAASEGVTPLQPAYPEGKKVAEEGFEYHQYEGPVVIKVPVKVAPGTAAGAHVLKGKLRYHTIQGSAFRKVAVLPVEVTVEVTAAAKGKGAEKAKPKPEPKPGGSATRP